MSQAPANQTSANQTAGLMTREDMLRELELLPVWQLRQPLPTLAKAQTPLADTPVEPVDIAPESPVYEEQPAIEVADSVMLAIAEEPAEAAVSSTEDTIRLETDRAEHLEPPVLEANQTVASIQLAPLRFLLCENGHYGFLMKSDAPSVEVQAAEALFRNMLRAMQVNARVDVTDTVENIFAQHTPKILLSMGEAAANQLFGKAHAVIEWRNLQQQSPLLYGEIPVIVTYHPQHLLQNSADKAHAWRDMCAAMKLMQRL